MRPPIDQIPLAIGNYHIVNQIIERGLHNSDDEIKTYTTDLVDKLEQVSRTERLPPDPHIVSRALLPANLIANFFPLKIVQE